MTLDQLRSADPDGMYDAIAAFPRHLREGAGLGDGIKPIPLSKAKRIVLLGMGGSAIGGDLLRSYLTAATGGAVDMRIVRGYTPPPVDRNTLVIASSYSGGTEETLAAFERVRGEAGAVLVITTGGRLGEIAKAESYRTITLPGGLQPRAALAYSFFPLAQALAVKSALFGDETAAATVTGIAETGILLDTLVKRYGAGPRRGNTAWKTAEQLNGLVPVVYSAGDLLDTVNLRWRGQIQENAKHLAFGNLLPEMNHNEINGWQLPPDLLKRFALVFLRDRADHERTAARIGITRRVLGRSVGRSVTLETEGESLLARIFSLVHLGDWTSWYMATMNGVDPMPVPIIQKLKRELENL